MELIDGIELSPTVPDGKESVPESGEPAGSTGEQKTPGHSPRMSHPPLRYGKKFHIGEFFIEQSIRAIAFLSIAAILGIFFYVFREAGYAFRGSESAVPSAVSTTASPSCPRTKSTLVMPSRSRSFSAGTFIGPGEGAVPGCGCGKAVDMEV